MTDLVSATSLLKKHVWCYAAHLGPQPVGEEAVERHFALEEHVGHSRCAQHHARQIRKRVERHVAQIGRLVFEERQPHAPPLVHLLVQNHPGSPRITQNAPPLVHLLVQNHSESPRTHPLWCTCLSRITQNHPECTPAGAPGCPESPRITQNAPPLVHLVVQNHQESPRFNHPECTPAGAPACPESGARALSPGPATSPPP
eukprot:1191882-Prorocentrum_minimum.AAC.1